MSKTQQAPKVEQELLVELLKGQTFKINLLEELDNDYNAIRDILRHTNQPTKVEQAYHDEQQQKLLTIQDKLKKVVRKALGETLEVYQATDTYGQMNKHFEITVYIKAKE